MDTDGGPDVGVVDHEIVGKELLAVLGFSKFVTDLVESHVPSKRYLVSTIEEYKQAVVGIDLTKFAPPVQAPATTNSVHF